ncbi:hypothetical protein L6164_023477 [Bauhinia variegata]|uniref:Uncharacterized protein n=1 Tax=Bauhinia variegata TaxID=167791 RepID=A0ACB9MIR6_BAUVA|nr:hypothetical protein L6164_023477 [Bauhinia variegata]
MNTIQLTVCQPGIYVKNASQLCNLPSKQCLAQIKINVPAIKSLSLQERPSFGLQCLPVIKPRQPLPVCLAGGKEMMDNDEGSPWKALEKAMDKFKGQSIEDVLREQIKTGDYSGDGDSGGKTPGGGGGGGGGGSGEPEEEDLSQILDETIQVVLATMGLIFMYVFILNGQELTRLAKDYIKYLFTGNRSVRLKRAMTICGALYKRITRKKEAPEPYWLEKAILSTRTAWDSPAKYRAVSASIRTEDSAE